MKKLIIIVLSILLIISIYSVISTSYMLYSSMIAVDEIRTLRESNASEEIVVIDNSPIDVKYPINSNSKHPISFSENPNKEIFETIDDYVGWLKLENTRIDYPVVKASDNDYYLDHDYYGEKSKAGSIFMDRRNLGNKFDSHTIIYGHHMKDGSMFTDLNKYLDDKFFRENKVIEFEDMYSSYSYQVISAYYVSADDYDFSFDIDEEYVKYIIDNSIFHTDYEYSEGDRFLTLSTCNYIVDNGRMMVHAVLKDK